MGHKDRPTSSPEVGERQELLGQVCTLGPAELDARLVELRDFVVRACQVDELPNGVALEFPRSTEAESELLAFVRRECDCCRRFSYAVRDNAERGTLVLTVRGQGSDVRAIKLLYLASPQ